MGSWRPATINLVAARAGVSRATVSRVMNGKSSVAPELAARVHAAASALQYRPSIVARGLAGGRTSTVALVVPDLANPLFQGILRSLGQAAGRASHRLLVAESNEDVAAEIEMAREARRRCDALVLCAPRMSAEVLAELAPELEPLVLLNRAVPEVRSPQVAVDYAAGIRDLVAHLEGLGHSRLAYLSGPATSASHSLRLQALHELASAGRIQLDVLPCGPSFADGHAAAGAARESGSSAVVAYNDLVALGVLSGLHELGARVPEQMSVVGFDDIPFSAYSTPTLTTAAVPTDEIGEHAWARVRALLDGSPVPADLRLRPRIVVRGSTAPAP